MSAEALHRTRQMTAIEAIAGGRYEDAASIVHELQRDPQPIQRGICRYCGCSDARGCAILTASTFTLEPEVTRCEWADADCTICSNVSCLERWRREAPAEMDVNVHDLSAAAAPSSRIVLP